MVDATPGNSEVPPAPPAAAVDPQKSDVKPEPEKPEHVYLVSYPKIMFLYPTVLVALFCAIVMWAKGDLKTAYERTKQAAAAVVPATAGVPASAPLAGPRIVTASLASEEADAAGSADETSAAAAGENAAAADSGPTYHLVCARIFLLVLTLNVVVIAFDFPRTTSLTWFFAVVAICIGLWTVFRLNPGLAPKVLDSVLSIQPAANAAFYMIFAAGMIFLYLCVLVSRRFDYWEVRGNELLHHHGVLSDLERFSAPNLRIDKEINDVFEYMLLRSGRLILHPSNERRAIVLENVLFISQKEERITRMLGALQVRVRAEGT